MFNYLKEPLIGFFKISRVVAQIQGSDLTQSVSVYEKELRTRAGLTDNNGVTSCGKV